MRDEIRCRLTPTILFYAGSASKARSADYNIMPRAALRLKPSPVTRYLLSSHLSHRPKKSGGHTNSAAFLGLITHHSSLITIFSHITPSRPFPIPHSPFPISHSPHLERDPGSESGMTMKSHFPAHKKARLITNRAFCILFQCFNLSTSLSKKEEPFPL